MGRLRVLPPAPLGRAQGTTTRHEACHMQHAAHYTRNATWHSQRASAATKTKSISPRDIGVGGNRPAICFERNEPNSRMCTMSTSATTEVSGTRELGASGTTEGTHLGLRSPELVGLQHHARLTADASAKPNSQDVTSNMPLSAACVLRPRFVKSNVACNRLLNALSRPMAAADRAQSIDAQTISQMRRRTPKNAASACRAMPVCGMLGVHGDAGTTERRASGRSALRRW